LPSITGALAMAAAIWFLVLQAAPLSGMTDVAARTIFGLKCSSVAILLAFFTGLEAIAHERLMTNAFDPLLGNETRRLKVNLRYAQNTAEQLLLFVPGLLCLAIYCSNGAAMRVVEAVTLTWIAMRFIFWIGYHRGAEYRVAGLLGAAQSSFVLLYVSCRFGFELGGLVGAAVPPAIVAAIEAFILYDLRRSIEAADIRR